jgi:hypothetical protein
LPLKVDTLVELRVINKNPPPLMPAFIDNHTDCYVYLISNEKVIAFNQEYAHGVPFADRLVGEKLYVFT